MSPLPLLFCVYHICSKLLKVLVYLSENFLVLQDPILQDSQYCSKVFHCTIKGESIFLYGKTPSTHKVFGFKSTVTTCLII